MPSSARILFISQSLQRRPARRPERNAHQYLAAECRAEILYDPGRNAEYQRQHHHLPARLHDLGDTRSVTITVEPTATGYLTNTARVLSGTTDPATTNNLVVTRTFVEPLATLGIQRLGGNQVRVSWPLALANHHLQQQTNLSPTGTWFDIPATPVVISNQNTVTEPIMAPSRFYRLRR